MTTILTMPGGYPGMVRRAVQDSPRLATTPHLEQAGSSGYALP
ncbi:hypothetical protein Q0M94_07910 [Deinococcus radiomollis]